MTPYLSENPLFPISRPPQRIVSLVPSQTELLYDLGLDSEVVGITKFCVHPSEWFRNKMRIGGTKQIDIEKIKNLSPDLILANKEENVKEQIEALQAVAPVWISDVYDYDSALDMMQTIGKLTCRTNEADILVKKIEKAFSVLPSIKTKTIATAYLIWQDPYMTIGNDTFIHHLLKKMGLKNVFGTQTRYPVISMEALQTAAPKLLLLSSEPYPFKEKHIGTLQAQLPNTRIQLVDGEMFSWYGSRMLYAPAYFKTLLEDLHIKPA